MSCWLPIAMHSRSNWRASGCALAYRACRCTDVALTINLCVAASYPPRPKAAQPAGTSFVGTVHEPLLPNLLPNSVARNGTGRDKERFETAKSPTIRHVSGSPRMHRDGRTRITKPLHCHCANPVAPEQQDCPGSEFGSSTPILVASVQWISRE